MVSVLLYLLVLKIIFINGRFCFGVEFKGILTVSDVTRIMANMQITFLV